MKILEIFEKLSELKDNPEESNILKEQIVDDFLKEFDEEKQHKFKQLLWRKEMELRKIKNPLVRAEKAYSSMIETMNILNDELKKIF